MDDDLVKTSIVTAHIKLNTCRIIGKLTDLRTIGCVGDMNASPRYIDVLFQPSSVFSAVIRIRFIAVDHIFRIVKDNGDMGANYMSFRPAVDHCPAYDLKLVDFFLAKGHFKRCPENDIQDSRLYRL